MHRVHWLWRSFHQMHHSAERVDSYGAFYFSPLDIVGFTFLTSVSLTVVGLSPQAVTYFLYATMFLAVFQHHQRPHAAVAGIHRADGPRAIACITVAAFTSSTIPTCRCSTSCSAPSATRREFVAASGFYDGASAKVPQILAVQGHRGKRLRPGDEARQALMRTESPADRKASPPSPGENPRTEEKNGGIRRDHVRCGGRRSAQTPGRSQTAPASTQKESQPCRKYERKTPMPTRQRC